MTPWTQRLVPAVWFLVACSLGALAPSMDLFLRLAAAAMGGAVAALLGAIWGPRTRPAVTWRWVLLAIAGTVVAAMGPAWAASGLAAAGVVLYVIHDHPAGPGAILLLGTLAVLRQETWTSAGEAEAWWLGIAIVAIAIAALLERERLAAHVGTPLRPAGNIVRAAWVVAWTAGFLWLRDLVPLAAWVRASGLDVSQTPGRVALVALLVLGTAVGGLLLRLQGDRQRTERP